MADTKLPVAEDPKAVKAKLKADKKEYQKQLKEQRKSQKEKQQETGMTKATTPEKM